MKEVVASRCGWGTKGCPLSSHGLVAGLQGAYPLYGTHGWAFLPLASNTQDEATPDPRSPLGWYLSELPAELIEPQAVSLAPQTLRSLSLEPAETGHHHRCPSPHALQEDIPEPLEVVSGQVPVSPRTLGGHKAGARLERGGHEKVRMGGWGRGLEGGGGASQAPDHWRGHRSMWLGVR